MSWPASIGIGILTGILGLFAGGVVMSACARWYRVSNFEGAAGYAVLAVALLGGIAGAFIGGITARLMQGEGGAGFLKGLGTAWGIVLGIAGIATFVAWLLADIAPEIDGKELMLEVEYRLPVGVTDAPTGTEKDSTFELHSVVRHTGRARQSGKLLLADARREDGRWIVPCSVYLFTTRGLRSIGVQLGGKEMLGFMVPLPGRPGREYLEWSEWGPRPRAPDPPWPDTEPSYRFRVVPIEPPPPGPTQEELDAAAAEETRQRFEAMDPDAPIAAWFEWARYGADEAQQTAALARIAGRGTLVEELAVLMRSDERDTASEALRIVARLPEVPKDLLPKVAEVGRDIAARIRKFNATTVEQDPSFEGAAEISVRFSAWMEAARNLRDRSGGDFAPELKEILELSRVRTDSYAMRGDVLRVASYWMQQWTGLAPLPTDPPPR